ncbi:MAG: hypothetical protein H7247_00300, partial [Polaromonas sp.]|nr:hypothetical protein [Gemmatimonadaceae bacterium]
VVVIKASDYTFDAPASIPAGYNTFRLSNGGKELHHVQIVQLLQGKTFADFTESMKKQGPPPVWAKVVGGPNASAPSGPVSEATVKLDAGNYALLCVIPSPDGTPHVMKGMVRPLTVIAASGEKAAEPKADVTVHLNDYGFVMPHTLTKGTHTFKIVNDAMQPHEMLVVALAPGKTVNDMASWVAGGMKGPPPAMPVGGVTGMAKGTSNVIPVEMKAGEYGLLCFMPDAKDGKPHVDHGMMAQLRVK